MLALLQLPVGFVVALSGVLIPGPLLAYVVAKSSIHGFKTGPQAVVGHMLVEFSLFAVLLMGLGIILETPIFQSSLGLLGGILLLALGALSVRKLAGTPEVKSITVTSYRPLVGGVLFSTVFNPTVILWWVTIGFAMLMEAFAVASAAGVVFWLVGHYLADFGWFSFISFSVVRGRKFMGTKGHRSLLMGCGAFLFALGIYLILKYGLPLF
jgi:threonine/homoserine/homoserine lactone efflux protein